MIIDAHHHFWDLSADAYPWLTPAAGSIYRTFRPSDLAAELERAKIDRTVLVQAADSYADTEAMLHIADDWPVVAGVVAWLPMDDPSAARVSAQRYRDDPRVVGVRHLIHDEPDEDWLMRPAVQLGLAEVAAAGLTFDVVAVTDRHLAHVPEIAKAHPQLRIVIDHLAKPPIRDKQWQPWAERLSAAAQYPNVYAKVSGLNTAADHGTWTASDLQPYVTYAVEVFGPSRLMWGSDWPVATLSGSYDDVWRATRAVISELSLTEQARILGGTAAEFYRLRVEPGGQRA